MDEVLGVNVLYPRDELIGEEQDRFQAESPRAEVEEILETRTQQLHDHHVEIALGSAPFDGRNSNATLYHRGIFRAVKFSR